MEEIKAFHDITTEDNTKPFEMQWPETRLYTNVDLQEQI